MALKPNPEDEVWSQEIAYWGYAKVADLDSFISLWHEDGIGWPNNQPTPVNREGARKHVAEAFEALRLDSLSIDIKPLSVNKCWQGRRYKTSEYKAYEEELLWILRDMEHPKIKDKQPLEISYKI